MFQMSGYICCLLFNHRTLTQGALVSVVVVVVVVVSEVILLFS